ncbi:MAG: hypothetical protein U5Q44_05245 [Dehalococcoidia bacterium]|nr:hypothetical protein [Dehalococcoidia bacterium]
MPALRARLPVAAFAAGIAALAGGGDGDSRRSGRPPRGRDVDDLAAMQVTEDDMRVIEPIEDGMVCIPATASSNSKSGGASVRRTRRPTRPRRGHRNWRRRADGHFTLFGGHTAGAPGPYAGSAIAYDALQRRGGGFVGHRAARMWRVHRRRPALVSWCRGLRTSRGVLAPDNAGPAGAFVDTVVCFRHGVDAVAQTGWTGRAT